MSRARNIKPGFFKNDLLAECDPLARILFAGLWCEADREGRLEDRPKRLKAECLPYDDCDVDALLEQLAARGFIVRYKVGTSSYIAIVEFLKHQNPHVRELASSIPGPSHTEHNLGSAQAQPRQCSGDDEHGTGPALSPSPQTSKEREGEPRGTVELPSEVDPERWQSFYDQLASDGKLSISRVKTAVLQLHRVIKSGHDPNAVLTAAVMRGLRDLEDTANRLAIETSKLKPESSHGNANGTPGRKLSAAEQVQQAIIERRQRESGSDAPLVAIGY